MGTAVPRAQDESYHREPDYWPTESWQTSSPETQGMNSQILDQLFQHLHSFEFCYNSFLVIRHGYIVFEAYPNPVYDQDTIHFLASVTKSFTAGIFGIAVDQGLIGGIHDSLLGYFPNRSIANPSPLKDSITIRDLLTMKTGLQWDEGSYAYDDPRNSFVQWMSSDDGVQFVLDLPMVCAPNIKWYYNTGASSMLSALISVTSGGTTLDFAQEYLFNPLGIKRYSWSADSHGINYGGFGLSLLPRDMAKYGFLYLQNGRWEDQQIISASWIAESTYTYTLFYPGHGYGYHWITYPALNGYAAFGAGGQGIFVIPKYDLVIVVTAEEPGGVPFLNLILNYVLPSLTDAEVSPVILWIFGWFLTLTFVLLITLIYVFYFKRKRCMR
jgi:CubicO group peptidase (beta-lactamase class C family)